MLLVLLGFFLQYKLVNCNYKDKVPNFNETYLSEQLHQSLFEVNAFLKDMQHNIHNERSALRTVDYEAMATKEQDFMDYSLTDMWWNGSQATGGNTAQTNFLPTHKNHGSDFIFTATPTPESTTRTRAYYSPYSLSDYVPKFPYDTPSSLPIPPRFTSAFNHTYITRPSFPFSIPTEIETSSVRWDTYTDGPHPPGHPLYRPPSTLGPWTPTIDSIHTLSDKHQTGVQGTEQPSEQKHSWPSLKPPVIEETTSSGYPWPSLKPPSSTTSDIHTTETSYNPEDYKYLEYSPRTTTISSIASVSTVVTTLNPNISRYVEEWLQQMNNTPKSNVEEWLITTKDPKLSSPTTDPTDSTHASENSTLLNLKEGLIQSFNHFVSLKGQPTGTPQNIDNWLPNKRLDQNTSQYLSPVIHRQGPPPSTTRDPKFATASEDPLMLTATGKQGEFFIERPDGLVYLGTTPAYDENTKTTVVEGGIAYIPVELNTNTTTTIAGDVLYGDLPRITTEDPHKEVLIAEMEANNRGYLLNYLIKLTELIAIKDPEHVRQVVVHTEKIIVDLFNKGRLAWFGEPLIQVTMNLGMFLSESPIDEVQSYSSLAHHMLRSRKESLAVDTNSIIDYAELLYEDDEGHLLIDIIKEFNDYPNITKSSFELADDLIEYFLMPYRRLANSERRQALLDSVNYALSIRFPNIHRRFNDGPAKKRGHVQTTSRQRLQKVRPRMQLKENKNFRMKQRQRRKEFKKARLRNLEPTHSEYNYENLLRRKYNLGTDIFPQMRRTKPITNIQKRFSIITSAQHQRFRGIMTRSYMNPNTLYINLAATRPTTDYKSVTSNFFLQQQTDRPWQRFYRAPSFARHDNQRRTTMKANQNEVTSFLNEIKKRFMISQAKKKAEKLKLKANLIKKIAEGSSYSDEEASIKMNLIDALLNRKKNTKENGDEKKAISKLDSYTSNT